MMIEKKAVQYRKGVFPKQCVCGLAHSEEDWRALEYCGVMPGIEEETGKRYGPDLEMRNCICRSSIVVALEP